ncbi:MAG: tRNA glutamyl-Q(34) synthetase GluQRS [Ferrovibrio sp.]|nr:tRNA glutamyl-Q(34) synthetase GluQRS [Ferrovibrio sp.]
MNGNLPIANPIVTRFAPSPTGLLHEGHAFSAGFAYTRAVQAGGRFLLRIEDIDSTRCRPEFEAALLEDLAWLGLTWEQPVRRQSEHFADYGRALDDLTRRGLLYPCFCTRKQVLAEIARIGGAPHAEDGAALYPGTCRHLSTDQRAARIAAGENYALRLDLAAAFAGLPALFWQDQVHGRHSVTLQSLQKTIGDPVLARKEIPASYHLCVTLDDAHQGVTLVTRAIDLMAATPLHRLLQALFGLATPDYAHHPLLHDANGERLAKRHNAPSLRARRQSGEHPAELWRRLGYDPGLFGF